MGTLFQTKPSSLSDRLPRESDGRTPDFAVPHGQRVEMTEREPKTTTTYVAHDHGATSGWVITFIILVISVSLGFMSLMDLSAQQNRTERELFELRQEIQAIKLAAPSVPAAPVTAPVEEPSRVLTQEDVINRTLPSLTNPDSQAPTELPPPPVAVAPAEPVFGPEPAPAPQATTPARNGNDDKQPVPGVK